MNRALWFLVTSLVASSACASAGSDLADSIERFNEIERADDRSNDFPAPLDAQFQKVQIAAEQMAIGDISDDDLASYFSAAHTIGFYTMRPSYATQLRQILDELQRRKLVTPIGRQQMLDGYIRARMFEDARAFAADPANAGLKPLPTIRDESSSENSLTLWRIQDAGQTLVRHDFELADQPVLLVLGPPNCSFSEKAAEDIAKEGDLFELMARHSIWLMPQSSIPDVSQLNVWSTSQPGWPKELIHLDSDWPFIDFNMSPGFYFLENGKVVSHVQGWPGPEQLAELREGFRKIGVRSASLNNAPVAEPETAKSSHP